MNIRTCTEADVQDIYEFVENCPPLTLHTPFTYWVTLRYWGSVCLVRSVSVLRARWGQSIGGMVAVGLPVLVFIALPGVALVAAGVVGSGGSLAAGVPLIVVGVALILLASIVSSTLSTLLRAALYRYATLGVIPSQFTAADLDGALYQRRKGLLGRS